MFKLFLRTYLNHFPKVVNIYRFLLQPTTRCHVILNNNDVHVYIKTLFLFIQTAKV